MRRFVLLMIPLALIAAEDQPAADSGAKKTGKETKAARAASSSAPVTIPAGAEQIGPYVYRYKDPNGKTWLYRKTPFGVSRMLEPAAAASSDAAQPAAGAGKTATTGAKPAATAAHIRVTDLGDSVRFEQPTPMGKRVWVTKKSELSPKEKAVMEQANSSAEAPKPEK